VFLKTSNISLGCGILVICDLMGVVDNKRLSHLHSKEHESYFRECLYSFFYFTTPTGDESANCPVVL
jgi:hypothetical protein